MCASVHRRMQVRAGTCCTCSYVMACACVSCMCLCVQLCAGMCSHLMKDAGKIAVRALTCAGMFRLLDLHPSWESHSGVNNNRHNLQWGAGLTPQHALEATMHCTLTTTTFNRVLVLHPSMPGKPQWTRQQQQHHHHQQQQQQQHSEGCWSYTPACWGSQSGLNNNSNSNSNSNSNTTTTNNNNSNSNNILRGAGLTPASWEANETTTQIQSQINAGLTPQQAEEASWTGGQSLVNTTNNNNNSNNIHRGAGLTPQHAGEATKTTTNTKSY